MSDFLILNSKMGISKLPETGLSTIYTLAADFQGIRSNALNVTIPGVEKILTKGLIGVGDEWASQADPDYANQTAITLSDRLNTTDFATFAARILSGNITSTETMVGSGVYDHVIEMKASSADPQLKSSTIPYALGGLDLILGGMVGNSLQIQSQSGQAPTFSAEFLGTGYWEHMATQTPALVLPAAPAQHYVGQRSQISFVMNDGTSWDLTGAGRLDSYNFQYSNSLITGEKRLGDPVVTPSDLNSGAYVRQLTRGERTASLSVNVFLSSDLRGYTAFLSNTTITNLVFKATGNVAIGTSLYDEVEVTIPLATITTASLGGDRKGMFTFNFEPLFNPAGSESGIVKIRVRNTASTLDV